MECNYILFIFSRTDLSQACYKRMGMGVGDYGARKPSTIFWLLLSLLHIYIYFLLHANVFVLLFKIYIGTVMLNL